MANERAQHGDRGANTREQDQERSAPREGEDGARRVKKGSTEAFLREYDAFSLYQMPPICQIRENGHCSNHIRAIALL